MYSNERMITRLAAIGFVAVLMGGVSPQRVQAQATVNLGGTGALGAFLNPLTVLDSAGALCNYDYLRVDMSTTPAKVLVRPFRNGTNAACNSTFRDVTAQTFGTPPAGAISDGILQVTDFTLRQSVLTGASTAGTLTMDFVPNADNTPIMIIATGNAAISAGTVVSVAGADGAGVSGFLRGSGGLGGPGGYRGGDGGNGGLSFSSGQAGFGPGSGVGGVGNATNCNNPGSGAVYLTSGKAIAGTTIPGGAGNTDLVTLLHGGSGGGGQAGCNSSAGNGAGGGGGAILIASNSTVTINGSVTAQGGNGAGCCGGVNSVAADGVGGTIRIVAANIAGSGTIRAQTNTTCCGLNSEDGLIRLEAFSISIPGGNVTAGSNVGVLSAPGQVFIPSQAPAFLKFASVTDSGNPTNTAAVNQTQQATPGRTGNITAPDVTMPNPSGPANFVDVAFTAGPCPAFPDAKHVTLVVTPLDPAQGGSALYSTDSSNPNFTAGSLGIDCLSSPVALIRNVSLKPGFSSMSAFTVVNISGSGTLSRLFPVEYQGEQIESVKIETNGSDTNYVLISKSGREFPFVPGVQR